MKQEEMVVGMRQVRKEILKEKVKKVFLADDADWSIKLILEELCQSYGIDISYYPSKEELGNDAGIDVPAATAAQLI